jgi:hypothetical protein
MTNEWCRIERLTPEEANRKVQDTMKWIDTHQKHLDLKDLIIYWRNAFWDLMYHRNYGPNAHLLKEIDQLRELNHTQAGRIMELEFENRCLRRVHDTKIKAT